MGISSVLKRAAKQTAVYWGSPVNDGFGGKTFADPVEVKVRWTEKIELFIDSKGQEQRSQVVVRPLQDMELDAYIYLGTLDDLASGEEGDPQSVENALPIRGYSKTPDLRAREFIRKVWL